MTCVFCGTATDVEWRIKGTGSPRVPSMRSDPDQVPGQGGVRDGGEAIHAEGWKMIITAEWVASFVATERKRSIDTFTAGLSDREADFIRQQAAELVGDGGTFRIVLVHGERLVIIADPPGIRVLDEKAFVDLMADRLLRVGASVEDLVDTLVGEMPAAAVFGDGT